MVVTVKLGPEPGSSVRLVPLTETTVAICCMPVPFWLGGGTAVAGGTGITLKTGVTVAVVPEIATDCAASRSKSSEVLEFATVNGVGKVKVKEVVASVVVATTAWPELLMKVMAGEEKVMVAEV